MSKINQLFSQLFVARNNPIIHNRGILYFIVLLSLAKLFFLFAARDFMIISIFLILGFLVSVFSKNMIIVLTIALCATHVLQYGTNLNHEGFEVSEIITQQESPAELNEIPDYNEIYVSDVKKGKREINQD